MLTKLLCLLSMSPCLVVWYAILGFVVVYCFSMAHVFMMYVAIFGIVGLTVATINFLLEL